MRGSAMKKFAGTLQTSRTAVVGLTALAGFAALAGMLLPSATLAQGQDKSAPLSQVQRLNRAPVNKEVLRVQLPRPTVVKLKNGLTIVLEEDHKLPTVAFTMWIRPGQLADPSDLPGLASFTAGMLREGTERRSSEQIASEVDSLGASLDASSRFGVSYTSVNASGLITDSAKILDLMSDVVLHPSFPASELAKFKQSEGASLEQRLANPGFLAQQGFRRVIYGDTPMALASATKESIEKVSVEDLKRFHEKHYVPGTRFWASPAISQRAKCARRSKNISAHGRARQRRPRNLRRTCATAHENYAGGSAGFGADLHYRRRPRDSPHRSGILCTGGDEPGAWRRAASAAVSGPARRAQPDLWLLQPVQRGDLSG